MLAYVIFHTEPRVNNIHKAQGSRNVEIRERAIQISEGGIFQAKGITCTKSYLGVCWRI